MGLIYLSDVVHIPDPVRDDLHPQWDTMIALRNKETVPVTARIKLTDDLGFTVPWPQFEGNGYDDHCDVVIGPDISWVASFLPDNGFTAREGASAGPPENFSGHGTVECFRSTPFGPQDEGANVLAFTLSAFGGWRSGVGVPTLRDDSPSMLTPRQLWQFAYAIPYFNDVVGATGKVWSTGISIVNTDGAPVNITLNYKIEQTYPLAGTAYQITFTLAPLRTARFDLMEGNPASGVPGLKTGGGYPDGLNSEGHVDIFSDRPVVLIPSAIIASTNYSFLVEERAQ